ncbi:release factor glutamine methyltransferase [Melghirimyces profundicolus]|uniref:Release factor glutamine methyltransferase n=1 Tax=Melghirimyces profundicolus TaxID=1242148 RepID=A0A2T6C2G2_9BACL|nr:peptide chain release factor N(5)-glutamine methyltransferase [Melghirimyces profundicolus]PTX62498.1 release factor glutamine methyltransferase [Melghirimyces profundicolus]
MDGGHWKTIEEAYRGGSRYLQNRGVDTPRFVSELLLRNALGCDRTRLFMRFGEPMPPEAARKFSHWLELRSAGFPVQYLLGEQEFYGRSFHVNPAVLIPRPETETLVETVLRESRRFGEKTPLTAVDVGTGSGAIAVTLAAEKPLWRICAVDRSADALGVARKNGVQHGVDDRVQWMQGDWLEPISKCGLRADLVVSNPPYIPSGVIDGLDAEVREHEPRMALDGGIDGLDPFRHLIRQLPDVLNLPGLIALEVGDGQSGEVAAMLRKLPESDVFIVPDLAGRPRVVGARIGFPR